VRRGSFFHRTECFGPVLGLMRATDLDEAIGLANDPPYGLVSGLQSLDDREVSRWSDRIEAGCLYVNRHVTGAIVGRQPFGGWKASSVGPGAKAGGPNYVLQLARWHEHGLPRAVAPCSDPVSALLAKWRAGSSDADVAVLEASAGSYALAWREHFGRENPTSAIPGERDVFRYRPCRRVLVRGHATSPGGRLALRQVLLAAHTTGALVALSVEEPDASLGEWPDVVVESETELIDRLGTSGADRLRALVPLSLAGRAAAHGAGIAIIDAPVLATGRLELRWYLREQTVSRVTHRYGTVIEPPAGDL